MKKKTYIIAYNVHKGLGGGFFLKYVTDLKFLSYPWPMTTKFYYIKNKPKTRWLIKELQIPMDGLMDWQTDRLKDWHTDELTRRTDGLTNGGKLGPILMQMCFTM